MVDLIPKRQPKPIFGRLFFVIVSFAVLGSVGAAYLILGQLVENERAERERLSQIFSQDTRPEEEALTAELKMYQKQITMLAMVLNERNYYVPFFDLLETTTHPDVFFTSLQGNATTGVFRLNGEAASFLVLEQQRLAWKEINVGDIVLSGMQLGVDGTSSFGVEFTLDPEILNPK